MESIVYKKAKAEFAEQMARLITTELGTCDFDKVHKIKACSDKEIQSFNYAHIKENIKNYYIALYNEKVVGICGISQVMTKFPHEYNIKFDIPYREMLYFVVDKDYQRKGIGSALLSRVIRNVKDLIIYEAWGDGEYVNSKFILQKLGFTLYKDLGDDFYKKNGYCPYCKNRNIVCNSCHAELWIKNIDKFKSRLFGGCSHIK